VAELREQAAATRDRVIQQAGAVLQVRTGNHGTDGSVTMQRLGRAGVADLPVEKEPVMKKILSLVLVAMLSLSFAAPASAGRGPGGGFHGGFHHDGFHRFGCCFGPAFVGGVFVGSAFAYPYYADPYYAYPYAAYPGYPAYAPAPVYESQQVPMAPSIQREVCYTSGCYHLQGDGVTVAYVWIWVPAPPAGPPATPSR
jgi:hypothetical protein